MYCGNVCIILNKKRNKNNFKFILLNFDLHNTVLVSEFVIGLAYRSAMTVATLEKWLAYLVLFRRNKIRWRKKTFQITELFPCANATAEDETIIR